MNKTQWISGVALVATAGFFLGAAALGPRLARGSAVCPVEVGQPFPEMVFSTATGDVVTTRMLAGRTAALVFTTPECPACKIDTPGWRSLAGDDTMALWQVWVGKSAVPGAPPPVSLVPGDILLDDRAGFAQTLHASRTCKFAICPRIHSAPTSSTSPGSPGTVGARRRTWARRRFAPIRST